ncbi:MAG: OB-fold nucleic acid binding domain-containing protein [Candidatus Diapherotrites archaeon]|nr:OB-fold nucleic acid binding domain-containing protein [Candidatus Diapherotrites archaeon]
MAETADFTELLAKVCSESGKSEQEIRKLIEEKKTKFTGLLTDSGAAFMVAKELKVQVEFEKPAEKKTKISTLEEGMKGLELPVRVLHVYAAKEFEKEGRKGKYCRLLVGDETGEISLTLWSEQAKEIEKKKVERGTVLLLKNAAVSSYKGQLQLGIPFDGNIEINPKLDSSTLPKAEKVALKISDLGEAMENTDVFARVIRVFEMNEFMRDGEKRKVVNFLVGDGSGQVRATAWNDLAVMANKLEAGELIKIEGAYTKKGQKGLELHLGWNSRIISNPTIGFEMPKLEELAGTEFKRKMVKELEKGEQAEVLGTITALNRGNLIFKVCGKCGSKAQGEADSWLCAKCGETKPKNRLVVTATIDDGTGAIRASVFGRNAEKILDRHTEEIASKIGEKTPAEIIGEISGSVVGKTFLFSGTVKANAMNEEELELTASTVKSIDAEKEMENALNAAEGIQGK